MIMRTRAFSLLLLSSAVASALVTKTNLSHKDTGLHVSAAQEGVFMLTSGMSSSDELCLAVENGRIDSVGANVVLVPTHIEQTFNPITICSEREDAIPTTRETELHFMLLSDHLASMPFRFRFVLITFASQLHSRFHLIRVEVFALIFDFVFVCFRCTRVGWFRFRF